jgi:2-C-methyl-D-erythritol 4-phosphate cytidylyltransferase/2-C-methyl-D-erythritol 2,4-cyclodiphosphate synthase
VNDWAFIILAAGESRRYGKGRKQYRRLGPLPLWLWSGRLAAELMAAGKITETVIVVPGETEEEHRTWIANSKGTWKVVPGGRTRRESVVTGLKAAGAENVLVHDAARPFVTPDLCGKLMKGAAPGTGVVPVLSVRDALKRIDEDGKPNHVDREGLYATQTPQAFPRKDLLAVLQDREEPCVDEGQAWVESGRKLQTVEGNPENFKITYQEDFELAAKIVDSKRNIRTGIGYDIHQLTPGARLVLGGVEIDSPLGPSGHSDGDALTHAICDALLGAAGESDIGVLFPASDPSLKGIKSLRLLEDVIERLKTREWFIEWVDAVIVLQAPGIADEINRIRESLDDIFGVYGFHARVNVRAKSGERAGPVGNSEAVECYAVATLSGFRGLSGQGSDEAAPRF